MIDINPELRYRIKVAAAQKDLSIREYIEQILEQVVPQVSTPQQELRRITQEAIEQLRQIREEIRKKHPHTVFTDSAEIVRQMREERSEYLADL